MTNNAKNVVVAKPKVSGGVLVAPVGTATPTDETTALNVAFKPVGYIADSGASRSEKRDTSPVNAWGGDIIAITQKSTAYSAKTTLAEYLNPIVQKLIYGDANVSTTAATTGAGNKMAVVGTSSPAPHRTWVFEIFAGDATIRIIFPDAMITDTDDVTYQDADIAARGVTLTLFPDAAGNYFYEYSDDGQLAAS